MIVPVIQISARPIADSRLSNGNNAGKVLIHISRIGENIQENSFSFSTDFPFFYFDKNRNLPGTIVHQNKLYEKSI
jgi:hypothetical protein